MRRWLETHIYVSDERVVIGHTVFKQSGVFSIVILYSAASTLFFDGHRYQGLQEPLSHPASLSTY